MVKKRQNWQPYKIIILVKNMGEKKLEASVGMSRKWDAREAGREVAESTLSKLNSDPDFFLLFSTIHYRDHGGFEEFLNGVKSVLPEDTPVIGGTIAGFMNNYGSYTRGTSALAVSYLNMDVAVGCGKNTKRNPKRAAKQSSDKIKRGLFNSKYSNKFLLNLVSGASVMKIPGQGYKRVIDSGFMSKFVMQAFGMSQFLFQKGVGREDEILEEIVKKLPDYHMVLGTTIDDNKGISNYQFCNDKVYTNTIINLGLSTDMDLDVFTTHGMKKSDVSFDITKLSKNRHIIQEINNKPAVEELYRIFNWPDGFLNEKTMAHTIIYYPISLRRHKREVPVVMPFILKDAIMTPCVIDEGKVDILTVSGKNIVNSMKENLKVFSDINPEFGLCSSCMTIIETLGYKTQIIREEMLNYFHEKPFIMFFCAGEGSFSPVRQITYANMSFNIAVFGNRHT